MSETLFTKGEWKRDEYGTVTANGEALLVTGVAIPCGHHKEESEANTDLLAAAPKMYEALEEAAGLLSQSYNKEDTDHAKYIYELLAKARGEK